MPPLRGTGSQPEAEHPEYAGQYRLEARLGSGGMGVVHLARSASGLQLAVKVVHAEFAADPEFRARFRQEVAAARRVSGAFTAPVVDADPEAERPWMATLYIPGPTLAEQVKRNGPMAPAELRRLTAGTRRGAAGHPPGRASSTATSSRATCCSPTTGPRSSTSGSPGRRTANCAPRPGKLIGTPPFMAPEQFQRPREVGPAGGRVRAGRVLVHAATGRGPFDSDSPYIVAYQVVHDEAGSGGRAGGPRAAGAAVPGEGPAERPTPDEMMGSCGRRRRRTRPPAFIPAQRRRGGPEGDGRRRGRGGSDDGTTRARRQRARARGCRRSGRRRRSAVGGGRRGPRWPPEACGRPARETRRGRTPPGTRSAQATARLRPWRRRCRRRAGATPALRAARAPRCTARRRSTAGPARPRGRPVWCGRTGQSSPEAPGPRAALGRSGVTAAPGGPLGIRRHGRGQRWSGACPRTAAAFPAGATLLMVARTARSGLDAATGDARWQHSAAGPRAARLRAVRRGDRTGVRFEHAADGSHTLVTAVGAGRATAVAAPAGRRPHAGRSVRRRSSC